MTTVFRSDAAGIKKYEVTAQGFLKIPAYISKVGINTYVREDGSIYKELRLPEEVFKADSLATLKSIPVTDLHHGLVNPENVRTLQRGIVMEDVKQDGDHVKAHILVQDAELIAAIKRGDRRELSPGYHARVEHNPGVWQGQRYDGIQRDITYNHMAVLPRGSARQGPTVQLHLDSKDAELNLVVNDALKNTGKTLDDLAKYLQLDATELNYKLDGWEPTTPEILAAIKTFGAAPTKELRMKTLKLDSVEVSLEDGEAVKVEKAFASLQAQKDSAVARADSLQAKIDTELSDVAIARKVAERTALETHARKLVGATEKFDGLSTRDVQIKAIAKVFPDFTGKDKSDDYVTARFDSTVELWAKQQDAAPFTPATKAEDKQDSASDPVEAARLRAKERSANAWKTPAK